MPTPWRDAPMHATHHALPLLTGPVMMEND